MASRFVAALAALLCLVPGGAAALQVGAEVEAIFPTDDAISDDVGFGVAGRLGWVVPAPVLELVPEIRVAYADFAAPAAPGLGDISLLRLTAGARLGIGEILRPTIFAHVGWGNVSFSESDEAFFESTAGLDDSAFTWDAGLSLDLLVLPLLDVGIHGAYNRLETDAALEWWSAGVHAVIGF